MRRIGIWGIVTISAMVFMAPGRCGAVEDDNNNNGNSNSNNTVEPDQDAQEAITAAAEALEANRVAAEITNSAGEGDDGASQKADGCPNVSRVDTTVTIDYGTGCTPAAGFVPYDLSGSMTLAMDVSAKSISGSFDSLTYGPYRLDGDISAAYTREVGLGMDFSEQMDLTFTAAGSWPPRVGGAAHRDTPGSHRRRGRGGPG